MVKKLRRLSGKPRIRDRLFDRRITFIAF
jgi:hypothetical protein